MTNNRFINKLNDTPLHSSAYAEVARKHIIGSHSPQSYSQRTHIERNRRSVAGYHHSLVANNHHRVGDNTRTTSEVVSDKRLATESPRSQAINRMTQRRNGSVMSDVIRPVARPGFSEPQARGYNPYK